MTAVFLLKTMTYFANVKAASKFCLLVLRHGVVRGPAGTSIGYSTVKNYIPNYGWGGFSVCSGTEVLKAVAIICTCMIS